MAFSNLYKGALMLGCLLAAHSAQAAHFLYTGGHSLRAQSLVALGYTYSEFTPDDAGWSTALSGGNGPFDAIVVGEQQSSYTISATTQGNIAAYVSGGGKLVIATDHASALSFLNPVFSYSAVQSYGCGSDESVGSSLVGSLVLHSGFISGAPNLRNLSCTSALVTTSLPSTAQKFYQGPGTTQAFTSAYGVGQFVWLAWDYCCGDTKAYEDDWYFVLASSLAPNYQICSVSSQSSMELRYCQNACEVRNTPASKATAVATYTRLFNKPPVCAIVLPNDFSGGG